MDNVALAGMIHRLTREYRALKRCGMYRAADKIKARVSKYRAKLAAR